MTKELLQRALDALEVKYSDYIYDGAGPAIAGAFEADVAALRARLAAPADMVMVPREPTQAMLDAMQSSGWMPGNYRAMIAAAPAPAVPCEHRLAKYDITFTQGTCQDCGAKWTASQGWSAAPAVREPLTREQQIAIREAHCNTASDEYFGARPQVDDATKRRIYEAGFKEGWESGIGGGGK